MVCRMLVEVGHSRLIRYRSTSSHLGQVHQRSTTAIISSLNLKLARYGFLMQVTRQPKRRPSDI